MGAMIDGIYQVDDPAPNTNAAGEFERQRANIRHWITETGAPGPTGSGGFTPEDGRYHLYVSWNCPWAHRTLLTRAVLGLDSAISVSYARPRRTDQGWVYDAEGAFADDVLGVAALHEVYARQTPGYTGRITVPVLWDRQTGQIVSNESADIIRMFAAFGRGPDLYPAERRDAIDRWNDLIYRTVNNGVYRAGFARTQEAYDRAVVEVFDTLDRIEAQLGETAFLAGDAMSEADLRLFPTLVRFDVAYHYAFKCNIRRIADYPNIWGYARRIYATPQIGETVRFDLYKMGYFSKSELRNPLGIVPMGPQVDWSL